MGKITFRKFLEEHGALERYVRGRIRSMGYPSQAMLSLDKPYYWLMFAFNWNVVTDPPGFSWCELDLEWGHLVIDGKTSGDPGFPLGDRLGLALMLTELEDGYGQA